MIVHNPPQQILIKSEKGEEWQEVFGIYYLSNMGRWYSKKTKKEMPQSKNNSGYLRACLYIEGKRKWILTHIKVVEIFGDKNGTKLSGLEDGLLKNKMSIDHLNKKRDDARSCNLELVTHQENCLRKFKKEKEK